LSYPAWAASIIETTPINIEGFIWIIISNEGLNFVELLRLGVNLIDEKDFLAVTIRTNICVDMIAVRAFRSLDVSIMVGAGIFPRLSVLVYSPTNGASRILD